ncbi:MAG: hypothetical protein DRQ51_09875 [Gammaproteobacteria bacterium]|nr:MAG: hypothetical protein DRQ51_09875 [Gammaproteobacteria bacterium]
MRNLSQLKKQQVGLRLPVYLIEKLDKYTMQYKINRTDIITESIKTYMVAQENQEFYNSFDKSCKELKAALGDPDNNSKLSTLDEVLNEL